MRWPAASNMRGIMAKNVEPAPGSLATETLPPSKWASFRVSGRPRPMPFTRFCKGFSICPYSSKIRLEVVGRDPDSAILDRKLDHVAGPNLRARPGSRHAR